ncbi:MAG: class I SAM-dependent methyltransferase [Gemmataceae bacterium]
MPDAEFWGSFFNPRCILEKLDCAGLPGDVVEFGCGYGTFTVAAAELIAGRIFALDIEPAMIAETARKSVEAGLANVVVEQRDMLLEGSGRPSESAVYAMLFNILHIEDPIGLLRECHRILKPGGSLGIIHWRTDIPTPRGPSPAIRPHPAQCRNWAETAGFRYIRDEALCCCSWHWGLVMRKP